GSDIARTARRSRVPGPRQAPAAVPLTRLVDEGAHLPWRDGRAEDGVEERGGDSGCDAQGALVVHDLHAGDRGKTANELPLVAFERVGDLGTVNPADGHGGRHGPAVALFSPARRRDAEPPARCGGPAALPAGPRRAALART